LLSVGVGELDSDLIATSQIGVGNLRVRDLESGPVLNAEGKLAFRKLRLAPVPSSD
jgi:hypothetical protein